MSSNRLKLNPTKTEFLWAATNRRRHLIDRNPISFAGAQIQSSVCVKLLGVHIDEELSMSTQINKTVSSGFFHLRQIKSIRKCLPTDAARSLVNAFVVSRLDYCNGIYAGLPKKHFDRLQSVFNAASRLIFGASRSSHITPLIRDKLHWLQCKERVQFKLCVIVFKALHGMAPSYITELCIPETRNTRHASLRSAATLEATRLAEPKRSIKTKFGERAFAYSGPASWNALPAEIRQITNIEPFKKQLKTHFFRISYPEL